MAIIDTLSQIQIPAFFTTSATSFALISAAEIGDKSQLVCMTLASRHRATPVLLGAFASFGLLNTLAVVFGSVIANWLPEYTVSGLVCLLFAGFGLHALGHQEADDTDEVVVEKSGHNIFITTFLLITLAEFGDKTQLAVVAFSSNAEPTAVWLGASLALLFTSSLGVLAGRTVLQKLPLSLLHKISGGLFMILAVLAGFECYQQLAVSDILNRLSQLITG